MPVIRFLRKSNFSAVQLTYNPAQGVAGFLPRSFHLEVFAAEKIRKVMVSSKEVKASGCIEAIASYAVVASGLSNRIFPILELDFASSKASFVLMNGGIIGMV